MKRLGTCMLLIVMLTSIGFGIAGAQEAKMDKVVFHLNWIPNSMHKVLMGGVYGTHSDFLAGGPGFFAQEGIELKIIAGRGSGVSIKAIALGGAQFGLASGSVLMIAKSKNEVPVTALANMNRRGMTAIFYRKDSGIKTAQDFAGKTIAGNFKSLKSQAAKIYFATNNVPVSGMGETTPAQTGAVKFIGVPPGKDLLALMEGQVDACTFAIGAGITTLKMKGKLGQFDYIFLEDEGITLVDLCVVVNDTVLSKQPDLVDRFMRAMMRSIQYSAVCPRETNIMLNKHWPTISLERLEANAEYERFLWKSEETRDRPLGWISMERILKSQVTLKKADKLKELFTEAELKKFFINRYVTYPQF